LEVTLDRIMVPPTGASRKPFPLEGFADSENIW
jgi:hypothetical protein